MQFRMIFVGGKGREDEDGRDFEYFPHPSIIQRQAVILTCECYFIIQNMDEASRFPSNPSRAVSHEVITIWSLYFLWPFANTVWPSAHWYNRCILGSHPPFVILPGDANEAGGRVARTYNAIVPRDGGILWEVDCHHIQSTGCLAHICFLILPFATYHLSKYARRGMVKRLTLLINIQLATRPRHF